MRSGKRAGFAIAFALTMLACSLPAAQADTLYVNGTTGNDAWDGRCEIWDGATCGPKATIQAGIAAAVAGDEVAIADGTYTGAGNKNLDFLGKAITVRSASGDPALCIIDCEGDGRGFYFHSGEGADSIVDGLTITNGNVGENSPGGGYGGAVYCEGSSPTLTNCVVRGSVSQIYCGGVYCHDSSPTLTDCTISGNSAPSYGGGLYLDASSPSLTRCTIVDNSAYGGAGVFCWSDSSPTLTDCTIRGNSSRLHGAGLCLAGGSPTLARCTISGNLSRTGSGGGVYCSGATAIFVKCAISGNAARYGGGLSCNNASPTLTDCTINGNIAQLGAGIDGGSGAFTLTNCTISGNSASIRGGGMRCYGSQTLTNCIMWGDTPEEISVDSVGPVATYCDIQGGWPGAGNIDADPLFALPGDFRLMAGSPCIDAGTNTPSGGLPAYDPDGNARPLDGNADGTPVADIGAHEFAPGVASIGLSPVEFEFVAPHGGANPARQTLSIRNHGVGTLSWEITGQPAWLAATPSAGMSVGDIDEATLNVHTDGLLPGMYVTTLHVSSAQAVNSPRAVTIVLYVVNTLHVPGVYPTIQAAIDAAHPRDEVVIADGTYTGVGNKDLDFGGKKLTVRSAARDPASCIIDCEGSGRGFYFHNREAPESVVEGLTITNGYALGGQGGAVYCFQGGRPEIRNCAITGNQASQGAGIYCYDSSPTFIACAINQNWASFYGGGIHCYQNSDPTFIACAINGNAATSGGGGVSCYYNDSNPVFSACSIDGNYGSEGGGIYCDSSGNPVFRNCTINGNQAHYDGGGVHGTGGSAVFANCTIAGNGAPQGAALACDSYQQADPSSLVLTNCILWSDGDEIWNNDGSTLVLTYCNVQGGWVGVGNIDADPLFVDPDGPGDDPNTWADNDYRLSPGSPCIDVGSSAAVPADVLFDLDGQPRIADGNADGVATVDMGAYERPATIMGDLNCDGVVNFGDINPFVDVLMDPAQYAAEHPGCSVMFADCDGDGLVDFGDINPFIDLLMGR